MRAVEPRLSEHIHDALVIGAGVAGLAATAELLRAGLDVVCLEARNRTGGRVHTVDDPASSLPIELGAEFIHGRSSQIWNLVREAALPVYQITEDAVRIERGRVVQDEDAWEQMQAITSAMQEAAAHGPDMPFGQFLSTRSVPERIRQATTGFVEGFNAARKEEIGIAALARDSRAAAEIDGDRNFRFASGYRSLLHAWDEAAGRVRLEHIVKIVEWQRGRVAVSTSQGVLTAKCVVITVPLGVLQAGAIEFRPEPTRQLDATRLLRFGHVIRIVFRWKDAWWEQPDVQAGRLADAGFWIADEEHFPVWWTTMPMRTTLLTGWSAGPHTDGLLGRKKEDLVELAIEDLARIAHVDHHWLDRRIAATHFHDWSADPWARGAYSYIPAGALQEPSHLAEPVEETLYFAGEATEAEGHGATVHGAIGTGRRAAAAILRDLYSSGT